MYVYIHTYIDIYTHIYIYTYVYTYVYIQENKTCTITIVIMEGSISQGTFPPRHLPTKISKCDISQTGDSGNVPQRNQNFARRANVT